MPKLITAILQCGNYNEVSRILTLDTHVHAACTITIV